MPKFRYAKPAPIKWYGYFQAAILRRTYSGGFRFHCRYGPCGLVDRCIIKTVIEYLNIKNLLWRKIFHMKISDNASFSLQLFVFVHVSPVFSVLLTYSLKINSFLFWPTRYVTVECPSVSLSVCPIDRQQQRRPAGLLLNALWAGYIDRALQAPCCSSQRSAANAGSVTLTADEGGWTQTCDAGVV